MAKTQQKDFLSQFRELSSDALNRLSDVPGGSRLMDLVNDMRTRLDDVQKRLRGLDELEKRVAKLEQQVAAQGATKATTARKTTAAKSTTARKPTTPKNPPA
jgi:DNA repair ATPase RecN